jgi:N-acetyl sugar amidotransferase
MKYCKKCLQTDTRPGIVFDDDGVCMACRNAEKRNNVDWHERSRELDKIVMWAKSRSDGYDCAIGVSGGKDSTFQALFARDQLGLRPLLVNCVPDGISEPGKKNIENLVQHGFDLVTIRPNPKVERYLSKVAFFKYGNFVKPLEYPLYASTYRVALEKGIPLVIQGENDADVFGVDKLEPGPDAMHWAEVDTVGGGDASDWVDGNITFEDVLPYQFPSVPDMLARGMRAIFLEYYVNEWSPFKNTEFSRKHGLVGRENHDPLKTGKINRFSSLDADLKIVNQMIKYYKFGFGACSDEVNNAIREGLMTRDQGIYLLERYDGKCSDEYIHKFCEYIDITIQEFWEVFDRYVNKDLFMYDDLLGTWVPQFVVGDYHG